MAVKIQVEVFWLWHNVMPW